MYEFLQDVSLITPQAPSPPLSVSRSSSSVSHPEGFFMYTSLCFSLSLSNRQIQVFLLKKSPNPEFFCDSEYSSHLYSHTMIKRVVFLSFSAAASATSFNNIINTEPMLSYQLVFTSFFLYYYYCYFGVFLSLTLPMADSLAPVFSARVIAPYEGRSCLVWILSGSLDTQPTDGPSSSLPEGLSKSGQTAQ